MKKHYTLMLISSVMAAVMLVLVFAEKPVLPSRFFGTITINNHPVPSGMSVTAWLGDQKVAETTVEDLGDSSVYVIDVPGDDLDTPELEGGTEGDNIGFKIKDMDAEETAAWHKGTFSRLCLNANPPPSPPVADDQNVVTDEDSTIFITLTAFDPNLDTLTYQILTSPSHGFLSGSPPQVTYTPADNYYGTDSFTFKVNDGTNDSNTATVTITIYPIPDPPVLSIIGSQTIIEGEIRDIEVSAVDPDDDPLQLATENLPAFAQFTDYGNGTGNLSLQPQYGDAGVYTDIMISATDGTYSDSRNIMITVNDATPEPKAGITTGFQYNAAALINGSQLIDYSSYYQQSDEYKPDNVIDDNASTTWRTESGQSINQWITVELPGERVRVIDRISLKEVIGGFIIKYYYGPKDFEIRVSTTGTEEEDFITVYSGTAPKFSGSNSDYEVSFDPVEARYVQLYIFNGYNSNYIETRYFKVWSYAHEGGIVSLKEGIPATIVNYSSQNSTSTRSGLILDEKQTTYWNSVYGESSDQWVTVELGGIQVHTINRIRIRSINNSHVIKDFEIRISASTPDDPAFNTVFTGTAEKTGAIQEFSFDPVQARYIQLYITSVYDGFPLRLSDFFVLTPDSANVARSAGVGAFVVDCTGENKDAEGAIDYDGSTKWTPGTDLNFPQYLTVRLTEGKSYVINRINLNCRNDFRVKDFQIRVSTTSSEPTAFTPVFSGTYNPNKEIYTFPPVLAKYVQLYVITPYNTSFGIWINSFKVFSSQLGGRTVPLEDFSVYPGGQIVARDWDFGDGNTSTQQCPLHTYTVPGTYTIHLTVTGDDGLTDTATLDYTVLHYPQPRISWSPQLPHEGQQIQFADSTEETDCIILNRKWQFEGAEHTSSNEPNSNNKYPDNGEYPISLEVMDNQFLSSTAYDTITVINSSPLVDIYKRVILVNDSIRISPTATDSGSADISTLQYHWDLGDGHTYDQKELNYAYDTTGLFDVILTVTDKDGGIGEDTTIFEIVTQEELDNIIIPNTIQSGLEWLAAEQCDNGSWGLYQVNDPRKVGRTGLAVLIFENHAVQHGTDPFDPNYTYCNQVKDGLSYIFSQTEYVSISPQIAGNPDSDGDGLGIRFSNSREMYEPSVAVMAIAASTHPEHIVNQPDCEVHGRTYVDIVTNIIDYISFGQNDSDCGNYRGGWGYGANTGRSDNSVAGYVIFGLAYAASPPTFGFGLSIPAFVKDELNVWIDYVQNDNSGGAGYESPTNDVNVLKTGHLLQQQAFLGDSLNSPRIQQALSYIENNWNTLYIDPDQAELKIKKQAFFTCMKGFEALGLDSIDTDGDGLRDDSWYNEMAVGLISEQKSEGYWPQHYQRDRDILLSTEWALLVLQKNIPPLLKYDLMVEVLDEATGTYINGAIVEVKGPESRIQTTQGDSAVVFAELLKGEYRLQVTADGYRIVTDTLDIDVETNIQIRLTESHQPPVITDIGDQIVDEGDTLDIAISATDPDNTDLTLTVVNIPSFMVLTDNGDGTGILRATPDYKAAGIYPDIQVIVSDSVRTDTTSFTLTVNNVNRAPECTPLPDVTLFEGDTLSIHITATDPDGDTLTITSEPLLAFTALTDSSNGSGTLMLAPQPGDAGEYLITIICSDQTQSVSEDFTLTVEQNFFPVADAGGPYETDEGLTLLLDGSASLDENQDTLSYVWELRGQTYSGVTVEISAEDDFTAQAVLTVKDPHGGIDTDTAEVVVTNLRPEYQLDPQGIPQVIPLAGDTLSLFFGYTDPGTDTCEVVVDYGDGSGTEILEPDSNDLFQVQHVFQLPEMKLISVNLRDEDGGENLLEFPFPIMPRIRVTAEPDTTVEEGEDVIFTSIAEGAEEEMLFGEWLIKDESGDIIDGEEALFTFLYLFADNGSYEVICIAYMEIEMYLMYLEQQAMQILEQLQDSEYYQYMEQILAYVLQNYTDYYSEDELMMMFSDMDTLSVSVLNVAPQADAGPDTTGIEQQSLPFIGSFTDPGPEDTHTIEWDFGDGSPVSTTIVTSHSFAVPGDYTVVLTVTDKDGDAGTDSCMVTIEPDNQKPELIPIADQVMDEGDSLTVNITAADADGDTVEISARNLPAFAALTDYGNNTGSLLLTPDYEQAGIYTAVSVMVSDGELSDTTTFSITVNDVNRAPELTTIPDQMVDEGDTLLIPLTASDPDTGDVISFSVSALPQFGALTDQGEGTAEIMLSPDYNQAGSYEGISVMVSDGELSDTTTFSITVNNVNRAPELTTIPDQMMDEADTLVVSLTAADPDSGDMVILSVSNLPQFGSFTDQGEGMGEIMIYPDYEQAGSYENILIQASDGTLADSVSFTLTVTNVNRKPVMADIADQEMDIWESLQVSCSATDPDQEPLTYSLSNAPDFAQLTDQGDGTADILCAPQVTEDGVYADIMVIVSDGDLADTTWFQLTVYPGIFTQGLALIVYQGIDVNTGVIQGAAQQLTGQQIKMEGNALLQGDLLVPGTPSISVQEQAQYTGIQEGSGSTEPSGYTITLRGNASVGWIRTRTDPVDMPQVVPPAAPAGTRYVNLNQPGDSPGDFATIRNLTLNADYGTLSVPPGTYGHFTANSQTGFVLGIPGSAQPVVYEFEYLTINANSTLEVVGPVIVIVGQGFNPNGQVGTPGMAAYLELQIAAGQVILNSGSELHCNLMAPNSQVMVNGGAFIIGGIACDELRLNGNAVIQVEGF